MENSLNLFALENVDPLIQCCQEQIIKKKIWGTILFNMKAARYNPILEKNLPFHDNKHYIVITINIARFSIQILERLRDLQYIYAVTSGSPSTQ